MRDLSGTYVSATLQECQLGLARAHACAYMVVHMTPLCDRDVADDDAFLSVEEGGVEVGRVRCQVPRRAGTNQKSIRVYSTWFGARHDAHA